MNKDSSILVTGASGMVGKSLVDALRRKGYWNILIPSRRELDLRNQTMVDDYFIIRDIKYVFHLAARVGGITANISSQADFLYDNLIMECNILDSARRHGVDKLLFLGSSCIYPRECKQPMKEEYLMTGRFEPTNEGYAVSKLAGLKLCEYFNQQYDTDFICLVPCNIYGPHDHFNTDGSHVVSSLITRFHEAKKNGSPFVVVWGSGDARREFLYVDDVADAIVFFMEKYDAKELPSFVNIGSGSDISIRDLAGLIRDVVGYDGEIQFDVGKLEGMKQKLLDVSLATRLGWSVKTGLRTGLQFTYDWYRG